MYWDQKGVATLTRADEVRNKGGHGTLLSQVQTHRFLMTRSFGGF